MTQMAETSFTWNPPPRPPTGRDSDQGRPVTNNPDVQVHRAAAADGGLAAFFRPTPAAPVRSGGMPVSNESQVRLVTAPPAPGTPPQGAPVYSQDAVIAVGGPGQDPVANSLQASFGAVGDGISRGGDAIIHHRHPDASPAPQAPVMGNADVVFHRALPPRREASDAILTAGLIMQRGQDGVTFAGSGPTPIHAGSNEVRFGGAGGVLTSGDRTLTPAGEGPVLSADYVGVNSALTQGHMSNAEIARAGRPCRRR